MKEQKERYQEWKATRNTFLTEWVASHPDKSSAAGARLGRDLYAVEKPWRAKFYMDFMKARPELDHCFSREALKGQAGTRPKQDEKLARMFAKQKFATRKVVSERPRAVKAPKIKPMTPGRAQNEANMELCRLRKEARRVRDEFMEKWKTQYGHLFGRPEWQKRMKRKRRELTKGADEATKETVRRIHDLPCSCFWCGVRLFRGGTVDHLKPLALGGKHEANNLVAACPKCNKKRGATLPQESVSAEMILGPALL